ncbi:hypothetical protein AB3N59_10505 [Leptospira sp. WS92.C1]
MKRILYFLIVSFLFNCYRFKGNVLDPTNPFRFLPSLVFDKRAGYQFFAALPKTFREIDPGPYWKIFLYLPNKTLIFNQIGIASIDVEV